MSTVDILNAFRDVLSNAAEDYLNRLEKDSQTLKEIKKRIVFCQDCKFSRVDMSRACGYYCGHPNHLINMECSALDFCSFGVRKE